MLFKKIISTFSIRNISYLFLSSKSHVLIIVVGKKHLFIHKVEKKDEGRQKQTLFYALGDYLTIHSFKKLLKFHIPEYQNYCLPTESKGNKV